jgi:DNA-binding transcriptional ArsR family regulator
VNRKILEKTREKILSNLNETPYITMNELAEIVGISKKVWNGRLQNSKTKAE